MRGVSQDYSGKGSRVAIIEFCMWRKRLYYTIGICLIGLICLIAIDASSAKQADTPQYSSGQIPASSTPVRMTAASSSVASSTDVREAATLSQLKLGVRTKTTGCLPNQALPDRACSPGAVLTADTNVICVAGYSQTVRDVPISEKQQLFAEVTSFRSRIRFNMAHESRTSWKTICTIKYVPTDYL